MLTKMSVINFRDIIKYREFRVVFKACSKIFQVLYPPRVSYPNLDDEYFTKLCTLIPICSLTEVH